jgi:hypothetical protein
VTCECVAVYVLSGSDENSKVFESCNRVSVGILVKELLCLVLV